MYSRPSTLNDMRAQLAKSGAGSIPEWVVDIELVDWSEKKLLIQLPSSRTVSNARDASQGPETLSAARLLPQRNR